MFRVLNILFSFALSYGIWELAVQHGDDPIKIMLICISAGVSDVIFNVRNKG